MLIIHCIILSSVSSVLKVYQAEKRICSTSRPLRAASLSISVSSSLFVGLLNVSERIASDTFGIGTLTAFAVSFPFREGIARTIRWFDEDPSRIRIDEHNNELMDGILKAVPASSR